MAKIRSARSDGTNRDRRHAWRSCSRRSESEVFQLGLAGDDVLPEGLELRALAVGSADDPALLILPRGRPPGALVLDFIKLGRRCILLQVESLCH